MLSRHTALQPLKPLPRARDKAEFPPVGTLELGGVTPQDCVNGEPGLPAAGKKLTPSARETADSITSRSSRLTECGHGRPHTGAAAGGVASPCQLSGPRSSDTPQHKVGRPDLRFETILLQ